MKQKDKTTPSIIKGTIAGYASKYGCRMVYQKNPKDDRIIIYLLKTPFSNGSYPCVKDEKYSITPKLSALLTGTPNQILNLITDAENGLFSRFAFYCLQTELVWLSPFAYKEEVTQDDFFLELGAGVKDLYDILKAGKDLRFSLTEEQEQDFDSRFSDSQMALYNQYGDAIVASIRRLGLITYRIAMILSALRLTEDGDFESDIVCLEQDYQTAAAICEVLVAHMARVYKMLPETPVAIKSKRSDKPKVYQRFYDALPGTFDRKTYSDVAVAVGLNPRSIDRTIGQWCDEGRLERTAHGQYAKVK